MAFGVRVPIADQRFAAGAFGAVGGDQGGGIDLEMAERIGGHVGAEDRAFDHAGAAQQQAASLTRVLARCKFENCGQCATCHADVGSHLHDMGDVESVLQGIIANGGERLDKALSSATGLSRERIKTLMGEGRVDLAGKVASQGSLKAAEGAEWTVRVPALAASEAQAQDIPLSIVFEDEHLIVIDKPAGLVVHPAAGNLDGTLVNALLHHCRGQLSGIGGVARPGIVHRIDKDTSGLMVVAKTNAAHEGLARQFADHSIERAYIALVGGRPKVLEGTIATHLGRSTHDRKKMAVLHEKDLRGKHAVTHYKVMEMLTHSAMVECRLETGRTHQVRVHMASIGHSLLGDPVYGRNPAPLRALLERIGFRRQALHAAVLGFEHPVTGQAVRFSSLLPADMEALLVELR
jgi:23S rRNA pseudouridine1911/1915/1917 synthase